MRGSIRSIFATAVVLLAASLLLSPIRVWVQTGTGEPQVGNAVQAINYINPSYPYNFTPERSAPISAAVPEAFTPPEVELPPIAKTRYQTTRNNVPNITAFDAPMFNPAAATPSPAPGPAAGPLAALGMNINDVGVASVGQGFVDTTHLMSNSAGPSYFLPYAIPVKGDPYFGPPQQNSWVNSGSGRAARV